LCQTLLGVHTLDCSHSLASLSCTYLCAREGIISVLFTDLTQQQEMKGCQMLFQIATSNFSHACDLMQCNQSIRIYVGWARTIYIRCIYGVFAREITKHTGMYGIYIYGSGQPYIYGVQYFWQGYYHAYGHIRCTYTVLANPICIVM
jgi:hypothetical protein